MPVNCAFIPQADDPSEWNPGFKRLLQLWINTLCIESSSPQKHAGQSTRKRLMHPARYIQTF